MAESNRRLWLHPGLHVTVPLSDAQCSPLTATFIAASCNIFLRVRLIVPMTYFFQNLRGVYSMHLKVTVMAVGDHNKDRTRLVYSQYVVAAKWSAGNRSLVTSIPEPLSTMYQIPCQCHIECVLDRIKSTVITFSIQSAMSIGHTPTRNWGPTP